VLGQLEQVNMSVTNKNSCASENQPNAHDGVQSMTQACDSKCNEDEERYRCEKCSFSSVYARSLVRHLNNVHGTDRSAIAIHKRSFSLQSHHNSEYHATYKEGTFCCNSCKFCSVYQRALVRHLRNIHGLSTSAKIWGRQIQLEEECEDVQEQVQEHVLTGECSDVDSITFVCEDSADDQTVCAQSTNDILRNERIVFSTDEVYKKKATMNKSLYDSNTNGFQSEDKLHSTKQGNYDVFQCTKCSFVSPCYSSLWRHLRDIHRLEMKRDRLTADLMTPDTKLVDENQNEATYESLKAYDDDTEQTELCENSSAGDGTITAEKSTDISENKCKYQCNLCGLQFRYKSSLTLHTKAHARGSRAVQRFVSYSDRKNYRCKICSYASPYGHRILRHLRCVHGQRCSNIESKMIDLSFHCIKCKFVSSYSSTLWVHLQDVHGLEKRKRGRRITYLNAPDIELTDDNEAKGELRKACDDDTAAITEMCEKPSDSDQAVISQKSVDISENKCIYKCKLCGLQFQHLSSLTHHTKAHTHRSSAVQHFLSCGDRKKYRCKRCGYTSPYCHRVLRHLRGVHGERDSDIGSKVNDVYQSKQGISSKNEVEQQAMTHVDAVETKDNHTSNSDTLDKSQLTHQCNDLPLHCIKCNFVAAHSSSLRRHLQEVHGLQRKRGRLSTPDIELVSENDNKAEDESSKACDDTAVITEICEKSSDAIQTVMAQKSEEISKNKCKYQCNLCGLQFVYKSSLTLHTKAHARDSRALQHFVSCDDRKRYRCKRCGYCHHVLRHLRGLHGQKDSDVGSKTNDVYQREQTVLSKNEVEQQAVTQLEGKDYHTTNAITLDNLQSTLQRNDLHFLLYQMQLCVSLFSFITKTS